MLCDAAVAVHPDDPRYKHLIGQSVSLPLSDRVIPVIADHYVDPSFGTGCVKITPAHDFNDYDVGKRHDLPLQSIMNPMAPFLIMRTSNIKALTGSMHVEKLSKTWMLRSY